MIFDEDTEEFINSLKREGTKEIYSYGYSAFLNFYTDYCLAHDLNSGFTLKDFFDRVEIDRTLPKRERKRVDRNTLNEFITWLIKKEYKNKTVNSYVGAIQSLADYLELPISTKYLKLPPSTTCPENKKHAWTIEEVGAFIESFESPIYQVFPL